MSRRAFAALAAGLVALASCTTSDHVPADGSGVRAATEALGWTAASPPIHIRVGQTATLVGTSEILLAGGGSNAPSTELLDLASGRTVDGPPLRAPRTSHTATMLLSGKVLLAGGTADGSAELYDPVTRTTAATGAMTAARSRHVAVRLRSGKVLVVGGLGASDKTSELYDPASGTWSAAPVRQLAQVISVTTLADGRALVLSSNAPNYEIYDPATPAAPWSVVSGSPATQSFSATMTRLTNGRIVLGQTLGCATSGGPSTCNAAVATFNPVNGQTTAGPAFASTASGFGAARLVNEDVVFVGDEISREGNRYTPATNAMSDDGALGVLHTNPSLVVVPGGDVFAAGGAQAGIDRRSAVGTWSYASSFGLATGRFGHASARLHDGRVLVTGGTATAGDTRSTEIVDAVNRTVTAGPTLGVTRVGHTMTVLADGSVLVAGGGNASAERFVPGAAPAFGALPAMTTSRTAHAAVRLPSGKVLLVGGDAGGTAELFDPVAGSFSALPTPTTVKGDGAKAAVLLPNGRVLVVGGAKAEIFEPTTSTFRVVASPGSPRDGTTAHLLSSGKVFVSGGDTLAAEVFDPQTETWSFTDSQASQVKGTVWSALPDGRLIGGGGHFDVDATTTLARVFDPLGRPIGSFIDTGPLPIGIHQHTIALAGTGEPIVIGGHPCFGACFDFPATFLQVYADGASTAARPKLTAVPSEVVAGTTVTIAGSGFANVGEASSGTTTSSATNHPLAYWVSDANDGVVPGTIVDFTDTSATWLVPPTALYGHGQLFVAVAGVVSRGVGVTIEPALVATGCENDAQCAAGFCVDGVCCDRRCDGACEGCSKAHKLSGEDGVCGAVPPGQDIYGRCVLKLGDACTAKDECGPNFCSPQGVCCDAACDGQCLSCNLAGKAGTCSAINEGACGAACDGAHTLKQVGAPDHDCAPFTCEGTQCKTTCASVRDCAAPAVCSLDGQCIPAVAPAPSDVSVFGCTTSPGRAPGSGAALLGLGLALLGLRRRSR